MNNPLGFVIINLIFKHVCEWLCNHVNMQTQNCIFIWVFFFFFLENLSVKYSNILFGSFRNCLPVFHWRIYKDVLTRTSLPLSVWGNSPLGAPGIRAQVSAAAAATVEAGGNKPISVLRAPVGGKATKSHGKYYFTNFFFFSFLMKGEVGVMDKRSQSFFWFVLLEPVW